VSNSAKIISEPLSVNVYVFDLIVILIDEESKQEELKVNETQEKRLDLLDVDSAHQR
jgi:hypothetical protein